MNSKKKNLLKNTIIVAIGQICTKFITFFLLPLYTTLLTTEEFGTIDLLNTFISLIIPIVYLQINQANFRFLIDVRSDIIEQKKIITNCLLFSIIQTIIFSVIYIIFCIFIKNEFRYFLLLNIILCMFSELFLQVSRGLGDNKTYSEGSLISGGGAVVLNVVFIAFLKLNVYGILIATMLSNLACILYVVFKKKMFIFVEKKYIDKSIMKKLLSYSIPLVPNQLSWWIINTSDRLIITFVLGVGMNGIYSAANKFSGICISFFNIFNMTWSESASMHINEEDSSIFFSDIINTTLKLFSCLCLCIIAIMPFAFNYLISGESFSDSYYQIPILLISTLFNILVSMFGSVYVALKKSKEIAKTSIYSAIINLIVNIVLINKFGLFAASISTLLSYLLMTLYRYFDVQKYIKICFDIRYILSYTLITVLVLYFYYLKDFTYCITSLIFTIVFSILYNKTMILKILLFFKSKIKRR